MTKECDEQSPCIASTVTSDDKGPQFTGWVKLDQQSQTSALLHTEYLGVWIYLTLLASRQIARLHTEKVINQQYIVYGSDSDLTVD